MTISTLKGLMELIVRRPYPLVELTKASYPYLFAFTLRNLLYYIMQLLLLWGIRL